MIDIKFLRENPGIFKKSQEDRGEDSKIVDRILEVDELRRAAIVEFEALRAEQNIFSKSFFATNKDARDVAQESTTPSTPSEVVAAHMATIKKLKDSIGANAERSRQGKELSVKVKEAEIRKTEAEKSFEEQVLLLSNLLDPGAPIGGEADFKVIEHVGGPRDFSKDGFEPRDHVELGKLLGAIDTERGAKVSGARSYYLTGVGALLEFALVNYAVSSAVRAGFTPVITPVLVNPPAMQGTGFLGQAAENVYHLEEDDLYLVGTSEVALASFHMDEILDAEKLPLRYAGYSTCFRREAGTYGRDTRGIWRVHQFDKVEMFSFCKPEDALAEHQRLLQWEKDFLNAMEIPYRVIDVASGDLGSSATRKFDCEAWIPTQGAYKEVTSTSNCTEFQARRLNIRMKDGQVTRPVATLNGTLVAITRMIVAILENHQNADGTVNVPEALQPFLGMTRFELV